METIGQRIEKLRLRKGMKKRPELARALKEHGVKMTGEMIRLYETDKHPPPRRVRAAMAKVFGIEEIVLEFGDPPPAKRAEITRMAAEPHHEDPRAQKVAALFYWLTEEEKEELLKDVRSRADGNRAIAKQLMGKLKAATDERVGKTIKPAPKEKAKTKAKSKDMRDPGGAMGDFLDE